MTPGRIAALQWFFDRGDVVWFDRGSPSQRMRGRMINDGQLEVIHPLGGVGMVKFRLTDKGRSDLHDAIR